MPFVPIPQGGEQGALFLTALATGTEQIRPGTNTVFVGVTIASGGLTLTLPAAKLYPAGKSLKVVNALAVGGLLSLAPRTANSNTLNGGTTAVVALPGLGVVEAFSDGDLGWKFNPTFNPVGVAIDPMADASQLAGGYIATSGYIDTTSNGGTINTSVNGGSINTSSAGGQISTSGGGGAILTKGVTYANRLTGSNLKVGTVQQFTDSTVNTWGATIAGSGANLVFGFWNGTNWTVFAR